MGIRYAVTYLIRLVYIWAMEEMFPHPILSLRYNTLPNVMRLKPRQSGGDRMPNPLRVIGGGIDAGIKIVIGIIILVLLFIVLRAVLSIAH